MGLTSSLNTSLNGLSLNEQSIDVLSNNISNSGTNGFKASKVLFATQLSRTISIGSTPTAQNGGTNPRQIGLGAVTSQITKDFTQGSITNSASPSDLAIQGDGFFIVKGQEGNVYTRNGNFSLSALTSLPNPSNPAQPTIVESRLQNSQGLIVQGIGVDNNFNLKTNLTELVDIEIAVGNKRIAVPTKNASIGGALLSTGALGTKGTLLLSNAMTNTSGGSAAANPITAGSLLTSQVFADGSTTALFTAGSTLTFSGRKGNRINATNTLAITAGTTVGQFLQLMDDTFGIQSGGTIPNDGPTGSPPGITVTGGGQIQVLGNMGIVNDLSVAVGDLLQNGTTVPITYTKSQTADGEGAATDFIVFDSQGQEVRVTLSTVMEKRDNTSATVRYFLESADDTDSDVVLTNGTFTFDTVGKVSGGQNITFSVDRQNLNTNTPMQVNLDFSKISGISTITAGSSLSLSSQDGSGPGVLTSFVINETGIINGIFDNGLIRTLGQIMLARFSNTQGLVEVGDTSFREGVSSGPPLIEKPGTGGAGTVRAGAIELSNTDIGRNLVDLIVASTNYRGNARVISSVQRLFDEILVLGR